MNHQEIIILGAGAAGLMCAATAGLRGRQVLVLDHVDKPGSKILIAGGGRCNFTNLYTEPSNYVSNNPHFCKSALARYSQWDFIDLVSRYQIQWQEREHGQLFCKQSAKQIVEMLLSECKKGAVAFQYQTKISCVTKTEQRFEIETSKGRYSCDSLVVATGGLSIPRMGATPLGLKLAQQFGLGIIPTQAALVALTLSQQDKTVYQPLSGISVDASVTTESGQTFREALLFTHRGLSGPVILQASNYWQSGEVIVINLLPDHDLALEYQHHKAEHPKQSLRRFLTQWLPKRVVETRMQDSRIEDKAMNQYSAEELGRVIKAFQNWQVLPAGSEGYRTAEATRGGVDTDELSSKTMMAKRVDGLYFIGEVVDVTGQLGGFNLQWAWSSGHAAGEVV